MKYKFASKGIYAAIFATSKSLLRDDTVRYNALTPDVCSIKNES